MRRTEIKKRFIPITYGIPNQRVAEPRESLKNPDVATDELCLGGYAAIRTLRGKPLPEFRDILQSQTRESGAGRGEQVGNFTRACHQLAAE